MQTLAKYMYNTRKKIYIKTLVLQCSTNLEYEFLLKFVERRILAPRFLSSIRWFRIKVSKTISVCLREEF